MNNLTTSKVQDDGGWLEIAVNSGKENVAELQAISDGLSLEYVNYDLHVDNLGATIPSSNFVDNIELLKDYYEAPPTSLRSLIKNKRNEHKLDECPSCGYPFVPDTLDHFVPKDEWPEFAIFPNNLVPQCRGCAPVKGAQYFCNTNNVVKFIHPIYSNILSKVGFKVEVKFDGVEPVFVVTFTMEDTSPLSETDLDRVKRHLKLLKVTSRFKGYCVREYRSWKNKIKKSKFDIRTVFLARISVDPNNQNFYTNWGTAFYKGLLDNQQVVDHLNALAPIGNPQVVSKLQSFEV